VNSLLSVGLKVRSFNDNSRTVQLDLSKSAHLSFGVRHEGRGTHAHIQSYPNLVEIFSNISIEIISNEIKFQSPSSRYMFFV